MRKICVKSQAVKMLYLQHVKKLFSALLCKNKKQSVFCYFNWLPCIWFCYPVLVIGKILQKLAQSAKRHPPRKGLVGAVLRAFAKPFW